MTKDVNKNNTDNAKEFMMSAINLGIYIENLQNRLTQLEERATNKPMPQSAKLGTRITQSMQNTDNLYCAIIMVKDTIAQKLLLFEKRYRKIQEMIFALDDILMQMVLDMRYLQGIAWHIIADELGYSERTLYRIHKNALEKIAAMLEKDEQTMGEGES